MRCLAAGPKSSACAPARRTRAGAGMRGGAAADGRSAGMRGRALPVMRRCARAAVALPDRLPAPALAPHDAARPARRTALTRS